MKKKYQILLLLCSMILLLSGCSKNKEVTIRYAAWNLGTSEAMNLERSMVDAFMEKYPWIHVVIDEEYTINYDKALKNDGADDTMPDVFMYSGNGAADDKGWCLDLSDLVKEDSEWSNIPKVLRDSTYRKGRIIAIPSAYYLYGYYANDVLLTQNGYASLSEDFSVDQFIQVVKDSTNLKSTQIGLMDANNICEWYPAAKNSRFGWFTWDGGKFNLNSKDFAEGIALSVDLNTHGFTYENLSIEDKNLLLLEDQIDPWTCGTVALKFDGTWSTGVYSALNFPVSFLGIPGGRTCIVPDYLFLSSKTEYPEESYLFAKFMSAYSEEGFRTRLSLAKESHFEVTTLPMINDTILVEAYFDQMPIRGLREAYSKVQNHSYVEMAKVLPGYLNARWNYVTNISVSNQVNCTMGTVISGLSHGLLSLDGIATELNYIANTSITIYPQQLSN